MFLPTSRGITWLTMSRSDNFTRTKQTKLLENTLIIFLCYCYQWLLPLPERCRLTFQLFTEIRITIMPESTTYTQTRQNQQEISGTTVRHFIWQLVFSSVKSFQHVNAKSVWSTRQSQGQPLPLQKPRIGVWVLSTVPASGQSSQVVEQINCSNPKTV